MKSNRYERNINSLIPAASAEASKKVKEIGKKEEQRRGVDGKPYTYCLWSYFFHKAMNRMAKDAELRNV